MIDNRPCLGVVDGLDSFLVSAFDIDICFRQNLLGYNSFACSDLLLKKH